MLKIFGLALLPLFPMIIESTHYVLFGDVFWSMMWGNEVRVWGAILSPSALLAIYFSIKHTYKWITAFPLLTFLVAVANPILFGVQPASKMDTVDLELLGFWTEQWQSWAPLLDHLTSQD